MGLPQPALAVGTLRKPLLAVSSDPGREGVPQGRCPPKWVVSGLHTDAGADTRAPPGSPSGLWGPAACPQQVPSGVSPGPQTFRLCSTAR